LCASLAYCEVAVSERVSKDQVQSIYALPFLELLFQAASVHRQHHNPQQVQWSTLLSIKTGACPEDCGYCAQSAHFKTGVKKEKLLDPERVIAEAKAARACGSTRFCMGAAWRRVSDQDMPALESMVREVKALGMETCMTLGTLSIEQAGRFKQAGLDYYNHNLDTSREHYGEVISTRTYDERLETLAQVRNAGIKVCCGGILGMGESDTDRVGLLWELANLPTPPESIPINALVPIPGTPLAEKGVAHVDPLEFVRVIATARILMPKSWLRLSAGRETMSEELQALCFMAGANSIFAGEKLLTTGNPSFEKDHLLLRRLGLSIADMPSA